MKHLRMGVQFVVIGIWLTLRPCLAGDGNEPSLVPVELDHHEFMEYAFAPFFEQLKSAIASEPADRKGWVPIKANSLILAENGNLLMLRPAEDDEGDWNQHAAELRDKGQLLYKSAKKRDYALSRKHFISLIEKCNACHKQFADGEHLQEP